MTSPAFEAFLARVYVDPEFRAEFLAGPRSAARRAGLGEAECDALAAIDCEGLEMAVASFASKRKKRQKRGWKLRLKGLVARG
jgi:hypothetical protein